MSDLAHRTTQEVFEDHLRLAQERAFDEDIARNFAPDCVILTGRGTFRGHAGIRELALMLEDELPTGDWEYRARLVEGDVAYLEWAADSGHAIVDDGADSFLIVGGKVVVQTIHYTVRSPDGAILVDWDGSTPSD